MTSGGEARGSSLGFRDGCGMRRALGRLKLGLYSVIGLLGASGKLGEEIFVNNAAGCGGGGGSKRKWKFHSLLSHWRLRMQMPVCNKCFVDLEFGLFFAASNEIFPLIFYKINSNSKGIFDVDDRMRNVSIWGTAATTRPPTHSTPPLKHHTVQKQRREVFRVFHRKGNTWEDVICVPSPHFRASFASRLLLRHRAALITARANAASCSSVYSC